MLLVGPRLIASGAMYLEDCSWQRRGRLHDQEIANRIIRQQQQRSFDEVARPNRGAADSPTHDALKEHLLRWQGWRYVDVVSVKDESPSCRSFVFRDPDGNEFPPFLGGQYLMVRLRNPVTQKPVSRCYSLSSSPDEGHYRITVKRVPDGAMSNLLHDTIQVGDQVEIQPPRGRFHYTLGQTGPLNLIAAGIGITPILSMLFQSLSTSEQRDVNLFYQLRNAREAPFLAPLRRLVNSIGSRQSVRLFVWFSRPEDRDLVGEDSIGRLTANGLIDQLGYQQGEFLICGPDVFMDSIARGLVRCGVSESMVKYESFGGKSKGPGAINVSSKPDHTQVEPSSEATANRFKVTFSESARQGDWNSSHDALLDVAEELDIEVDSGCRAGECGACVCKLRSGSVCYAEQPECDFNEGEVVLCVAKPTSDVNIEA